jgi:hypothetical protein
VVCGCCGCGCGCGCKLPLSLAADGGGGGGGGGGTPPHPYLWSAERAKHRAQSTEPRAQPEHSNSNSNPGRQAPRGACTGAEANSSKKQPTQRFLTTPAAICPFVFPSANRQTQRTVFIGSPASPFCKAPVSLRAPRAQASCELHTGLSPMPADQ